MPTEKAKNAKKTRIAEATTNFRRLAEREAGSHSHVKKRTNVSRFTYTFRLQFGEYVSSVSLALYYIFYTSALLLLLWSAFNNGFGDLEERMCADDELGERGARRGALPGTARSLPGSAGGSPQHWLVTNQSTLI